MGSLYLTQLADWIRAAGVPVVEYQGWQTRARSSGGFESGRPWGVMWHHTASQASPQSDADYMCNGSQDRPIANLLICRDGSVWVLAAGATNTNGKGSGVVWSRGRVPDDSMNTYAVGMEIACDGTGQAYPVEQIDAAFAASVAVITNLGLDPGDVAMHYTWAPTRKIDPATAAAVEGPWQPGSCTSSGTWDLNDLIAEHRYRCAGTIPEGDDMALSDDDKTWITQTAHDQAVLAIKEQFSPSGEAYQRLDLMVKTNAHDQADLAIREEFAPSGEAYHRLDSMVAQNIQEA